MLETMNQWITLITENGLYYGVVLLAILLLALKVVNMIFSRITRRRDNIVAGFARGCIQAFLIITFGMKIGSLSPVFSGFASQILMSSSLIVVVLGFVFQEGLSNIVHGFILMIFKPFQIGDRVQITIDGGTIIGYVRSIDLRSTIIENTMSHSSVIVPNSKMDLCVIDNSYFDEAAVSTDFVYASVTYESDLDKAMAVMAEITQAHPAVAAVRRERKITEPVSVRVMDFGDSGISLRVTVTTETVEENFAARSDIRKALWQRFSQEADLEFAYPHIQIVKES